MMRRRVMGAMLVCVVFSTGIASAAQTGVFALTPFLLPFPGARNAVPEAINNLGHVVGSYTDSSGHARGFVRDARGHFSTINAVFPGTPTDDTVARGINDFGVIVGSYATPADPPGRHVHGFVFARGVFTHLDAPFAGAFNTRPRGINDYGAVVGSYDTVGGRHAFVRTAGRFRRVTVRLAGADTFAFACAINNLGQVLGAYRDAAGFLHGFLAMEEETVAINVPGATETLPTGINDLGQVAGVYIDDRNAVHSFFVSDSRFRTIDLPGAPPTILSRAHLTGSLFPALIPGVSGLSNAQITGTFLDSRHAFHSFLGVLAILEEERPREMAHAGMPPAR